MYFGDKFYFLKDGVIKYSGSEDIFAPDVITGMFLGEELADAIFSCPSGFGGYQKIDTSSFFA